ncbi:ribosomal RNA-processing protein 7-domain-containing protein [Zychaea mexicana]|uniref:ribosomal RNA-processing protein 7-domain-containing protein n=1 Tax=Zychaea mexicana TaxID=64656 RepID=UPI0022FE529D|nr:ribosomal RNA-processing protein 7-domain-containing protein [Zychaea mexicana]KAI9493131.1 ribosomal RNA-processing protein 7-domain-containing protein [Zychaea mexicana]
MAKKKSSSSSPSVAAATTPKIADNSNPDLQDFYGFKALPVVVAKNCRHYIYIKKHEVRTVTTMPTEGNDRSLFVLNLPVDTTDSHLHGLFNEYGQIEHIQYPGQQQQQQQKELADSSSSNKKKKNQRKKNLRREQEEEEKTPVLRRILESGSSAHVVFASQDDLDRVLDMPHQDRKWKAETKQQTLGFKRYVRQYNMARPDHNKLQQQVNAFMLKFTASEYEKEREAQERMNKMDEDGFTVVTRVRKGIASAGATTAAPVEPEKKKVMGDLSDFYRFQTRHKKQNELQQLRERFEQDKQKIALQKQARRFKPY